MSAGTTEAEVREMIAEALYEAGTQEGVRSFNDAGVLTYNEGLVLRMDDGSEFQVTIVRSR